MTRAKSAPGAALLAVALRTAIAFAQSSAPSSAASGSELPEAVRALLATVTDHAFSFDAPGFYAVLEYVRRMPLDPGHSQAPVVLTDWRQAIERPGDFRGAVVTVEGVVGRNSSWQYADRERRARYGTNWQLELSRPGVPVACTLICTQDVGEIGLGSTIRATGYFVMARQYALERGRIGHALLVVAKGPTVVERAGPPHAPQVSWTNVALGAGGAVLLALLVLVRILTRRAPRSRTDLRALRAAHAPSQSLADDLASWAESESSDADGSHPRAP